MSENTERRYLKWYNKIGYGSGDVAGNVVYAFLSSFVMIYLTDTVGLNPGIVGTLIAVSKLFDGITDIFFGSMIEMCIRDRDSDGFSQTVTMLDAPTRVKISKADITTHEEIPGATLRVLDKNGNVVDEWVSENTPHYIEAVLVAGETYTLEETQMCIRDR